VYSISHQLDIDNSQINRNQAESGGGIWATRGIVNIGETEINENTVSSNGGGLVFTHQVDATINNSIIFFNQAGESGGGIYEADSSVAPTININNTLISENNSDVMGGGIYLSNGEWNIKNSTINGNISIQGGGILNGGLIRMENSTVSGNQADLGGGVLHVSPSISEFSFVTVAHNSAQSGGGFRIDNSWIHITNSIVGENSPQNCQGNVQAFETNLDDDGSCGFSHTDDPLLELLSDNGGPTLTHEIPSFSPAAEIADPCTALNSPAPITGDQRGVSRPQGSRCDLGAYEVEISAMWSPPLSGCIYQANKNSNCRESDFNQAPVVEILMQGDTAALVALNPENTYGKFALQSGERCWIALNLMDPQGNSEECSVPAENPVQVPEEKEPEKKTCKPTMGEAACKRAGGTWVGGITEAPHCSCP
jgi:hypothetical protein